MKGIFFFILTILMYNVSTPQNTWKRFYNPPNTSSFARFFTESYDKGYLIGGILRIPFKHDISWIIKTDINGYKLYDVQIGNGEKETTLFCLNKTSDGGFIAGGWYNPEGQKLNSYFMKFNACGEREWCTIIEQPAENVQTSIDGGIHELPDGSYIAHRTLYSFIPEYDRESLVKFRHDGSIEWINAYTHDPTFMITNESGLELIVTSDTSFLVTGLNDYQIIPNVSTMCPYWYKVDLNGNLLWVTTWVVPLTDGWGEAHCAVENHSGPFIYSGGRYGGPMPKAYIYKLSQTGDTLNKFRINDSPSAIAGVVHSLLLKNGSKLVTSTQFATNSSDNWWSINISDTLGGIVKQRSEEEQFIITMLLNTFDDKYVALGISCPVYPSNTDMFGLYKFNADLEYDSIYNIPLLYDSLCPHPISSSVLDMDGNCITVSINEFEDKALDPVLELFPNPCNDYVTVKIPDYYTKYNQYTGMSEKQIRTLSGPVDIAIYDISGKRIQELSISSDLKNVVINTANLPSGMYCIKLYYDKINISTGKFFKL